MNTGIKWRCWGDPKTNALYMDAQVQVPGHPLGDTLFVRHLLHEGTTRADLEYAIWDATKRLQEAVCSVS